MATERIAIMGIFSSENQTAGAIRELRGGPYRLDRVHSPIPSHAIADALDLPKSRVGWFTLAGGITGFLSGFSLAIFAATRWHLIAQGKPVIALVPFFIVGFEFTILLSVFGNVLGLISQARLPRWGLPVGYEAALSGGRFGVLASCRVGEEERLKAFFTDSGAEAKVCDSS